MQAEYDFSRGKRGALIDAKGKTRITIHVDDETLEAYRARAERAGSGYEEMMNQALRAYLAAAEAPVTEAQLRRVLREELAERPKAKRAG